MGPLFIIILIAAVILVILVISGVAISDKDLRVIVIVLFALALISIFADPGRIIKKNEDRAISVLKKYERVDTVLITAKK